MDFFRLHFLCTAPSSFTTPLALRRQNIGSEDFCSAILLGYDADQPARMRHQNLQGLSCE